MQGQIIRRGLLRLAGLSTIVLLTASLISQSAKVQAMNFINIEISGTAGTVYSAYWRVENAGKTQEYHQAHGQVPAKLNYHGDAISGTVTLLSAGQLTLTVEKNGSRSRSVTQGKGSTLQFSVR